MRYTFIIFLVVMTLEYLAKDNFKEEGFTLAYSFERLQSATQTGGSMKTGGHWDSSSLHILEEEEAEYRPGVRQA